MNRPTTWSLPRDALMANLGMTTCQWNETHQWNEDNSEIIPFVHSCLHWHAEGLWLTSGARALGMCYRGGWRDAVCARNYQRFSNHTTVMSIAEAMRIFNQYWQTRCLLFCPSFSTSPQGSQVQCLSVVRVQTLIVISLWANQSLSVTDFPFLK